MVNRVGKGQEGLYLPKAVINKKMSWTKFLEVLDSMDQDDRYREIIKGNKRIVVKTNSAMLLNRVREKLKTNRIYEALAIANEIDDHYVKLIPIALDNRKEAYLEIIKFIASNPKCYIPFDLLELIVKCVDDYNLSVEEVDPIISLAAQKFPQSIMNYSTQTPLLGNLLLIEYTTYLAGSNPVLEEPVNEAFSDWEVQSDIPVAGWYDSNDEGVGFWEPPPKKTVSTMNQSKKATEEAHLDKIVKSLNEIRLDDSSLIDKRVFKLIDELIRKGYQEEALKFAEKKKKFLDHVLISMVSKDPYQGLTLLKLKPSLGSREIFSEIIEILKSQVLDNRYDQTQIHEMSSILIEAGFKDEISDLVSYLYESTINGKESQHSSSGMDDLNLKELFESPPVNIDNEFDSSIEGSKALILKICEGLEECIHRVRSDAFNPPHPETKKGVLETKYPFTISSLRELVDEKENNDDKLLGALLYHLAEVDQIDFLNLKKSLNHYPSDKKDQIFSILITYFKRVYPESDPKEGRGFYYSDYDFDQPNPALKGQEKAVGNFLQFCADHQYILLANSCIKMFHLLTQKDSQFIEKANIQSPTIAKKCLEVFFIKNISFQNYEELRSTADLLLANDYSKPCLGIVQYLLKKKLFNEAHALCKRIKGEYQFDGLMMCAKALVEHKQIDLLIIIVNHLKHSAQYRDQQESICEMILPVLVEAGKIREILEIVGNIHKPSFKINNAIEKCSEILSKMTDEALANYDLDGKNSFLNCFFDTEFCIRSFKAKETEAATLFNVIRKRQGQLYSWNTTVIFKRLAEGFKSIIESQLNSKVIDNISNDYFRCMLFIKYLSGEESLMSTHSNQIAVMGSKPSAVAKLNSLNLMQMTLSSEDKKYMKELDVFSLMAKTHPYECLQKHMEEGSEFYWIQIREAILDAFDQAEVLNQYTPEKIYEACCWLYTLNEEKASRKLIFNVIDLLINLHPYMENSVHTCSEFEQSVPFKKCVDLLKKGKLNPLQYEIKYLNKPLFMALYKMLKL